MQRIHAAEPLAIEERTQRGQRSVGAAVALLRPGDQQRLQELRQALPRQHLEALLRRLPVAGPHLRLAQQELRRLAVRQRAGKLQRLGAAGDQAGNERLLQYLGIAGPRRQRAQELRGSRLGIRLAHGKTAGQELAEYSGRRVVGATGGGPVRRRIGCRTGRQQSNGEKERTAPTADLLHPHKLLHVCVRVMRI